MIRKHTQTCNFCNCLNDWLFQDRFVLLGAIDETVRKKLLQEKKLALSPVIDIERIGETTNSRLKELKKALGTEEEVNVLNIINKKTGNEQQRKFRDTRRRNCKYCGTSEVLYLLTFRCNNCAWHNHFAKVCLKKKNSLVRALTKHTRSDSSDKDSETPSRETFQK